MYRHQSSILLVAGLALLVTSCATVKYRTDYDRQADFVQLKTYGWMLPTEEEQQELARISPFLERRLTRALDRELTDRGYVKATDGDPDFWVSAYPVVPVGDDAEGGAPAYGHGPVGGSGVAVSVGFTGGAWCCGGFYGLPYARFANPYWGGFGYPRYGWYPGFGVGVYSVGGYGGYPVDSYGYPISASAAGYAPGTIAVDVTDRRSDQLVWRGWAEGALYEPVSPEELADFIDEVVEKIMKGFPSAPDPE